MSTATTETDAVGLVVVQKIILLFQWELKLIVAVFLDVAE